MKRRSRRIALFVATHALLFCHRAGAFPARASPYFLRGSLISAVVAPATHSVTFPELPWLLGVSPRWPSLSPDWIAPDCRVNPLHDIRCRQLFTDGATNPKHSGELSRRECCCAYARSFGGQCGQLPAAA